MAIFSNGNNEPVLRPTQGATSSRDLSARDTLSREISSAASPQREPIEYARIPVTRSPSVIAHERWSGPMAEVERIPLVNPELTREAMAAATRHNYSFTTAAMWLPVATPQCPSVRAMPIELLAVAANLHLVVEKTETQHAMCIIGDAAADVARPGMRLTEREEASRYAIGALKTIERLNDLGLKVEGVLESDLRARPEYREVARELSAHAGNPIAYAEACAHETARRAAEGAHIMVGFSSFPNIDRYMTVRQGLDPDRSFVRNCTLQSWAIVNAEVPGMTGLVSMDPARAALDGVYQPANPCIITPFGHQVSQTPAERHGRILLNQYDPAAVAARFPDLFDLPVEQQQAVLADIKYYWKVFGAIDRALPELLPRPDQALADLQLAERLVKMWQQETLTSPTEMVKQALWQSVLAAGNARTELLKQYIPAVVEEFAPSLRHISYPLTSSEVVSAATPIVMADEDFAPGRLEPRRGTVTLDTNFRGLPPINAGRAVQTVEDAVVEIEDEKPIAAHAELSQEEESPVAEAAPHEFESEIEPHVTIQSAQPVEVPAPPQERGSDLIRELWSEKERAQADYEAAKRTGNDLLVDAAMKRVDTAVAQFDAARNGTRTIPGEFLTEEDEEGESVDQFEPDEEGRSYIEEVALEEAPELAAVATQAAFFEGGDSDDE